MEEYAAKRKGGCSLSRELRLTEGPIASQLLRLALPILFANVFQQLYNIINSLVVTQCLGEQAFAALGVAESIMNLYIYVITGACMGASVLTARCFGGEDQSALRQQLYVSAALIGSVTLAAVLGGQLFLPQLLALIRTPQELMGDASAYLRVILAGMVFTFTYNYLASILRAVGDTKAALCFLLISLGYNIAAAWLLVAVLDVGILGAALATVSAQMLSTLLCFLYIRKKRPFLVVRREDMRMDRKLLGLTGSFAAVAALQQSSLYLGKLMIQSAVNGLSLLSSAPISAFTAANRVENFTQAFGIAGCEAIAIFTAQNQGAGRTRRALQGFLWGASFTVGVGACFTAGMGLFADPIAHIFLEDGEAVALCASYLRLFSCFFLLSYVGNSFVGRFRGSGRMNITFWGTSIQIAIRVAGTYLLVGRMGLNAVALSTGLGWLVLIVFQVTVFLLERRRAPETEKQPEDGRSP